MVAATMQQLSLAQRPLQEMTRPLEKKGPTPGIYSTSGNVITLKNTAQWIIKGLKYAEKNMTSFSSILEQSFYSSL